MLIRNGRDWRFVASGLTLAVLCLGCLIPSERGDRAEGGVCPDGEMCSELTPDGLVFLNPVTFDIDVPGSLLQLALVGGEYKLGMIAVGSNELPEIVLEVDDPSILGGRVGTGDFTLRDEDSAWAIEVSEYLVLNGRREGTTTVRVRDARTGELLDQVEVEVHALAEVEAVAADGRDRDYLIAGCEERVGVRLSVAADPRRAFDSGLDVSGSGDVSLEPDAWDEFALIVPTDQARVDLRIEVAGQTFERGFPVRELSETRFDACPE